MAAKKKTKAASSACATCARHKSAAEHAKKEAERLRRQIDAMKNAAARAGMTFARK